MLCYTLHCITLGGRILVVVVVVAQVLDSQTLKFPNFDSLHAILS